jgi:predicted nucleotidyltransferase
MGLTGRELESFASIFRRHPEVERVCLFGSRAKGGYRPESDVDLAVWGGLTPWGVESLAGELDELPTPYLFDVKKYETIRLPALREHIDRVGVELYRADGTSPGGER